jgi:hypothetical protein
VRVSCDTSDPGYINFCGYGAHEVLLNGSVVREAITADDDRGEVIRWARDEHGEFVFNDARDELLTELLRGKVEIVTAKQANESDSKPRSGD